jgi:hypothetical protein
VSSSRRSPRPLLGNIRRPNPDLYSQHQLERLIEGEPEETARPTGQPRRSLYPVGVLLRHVGERLDGSRRPPKDIYLYIRTPDFGRNAELRILLRCYSNAKNGLKFSLPFRGRIQPLDCWGTGRAS